MVLTRLARPAAEAFARVTLDPPDAADGALWFNATAWQGQEGQSVVTELDQVGPGVYRTATPIPLYGDWKTTLRLHNGRAVQGLAVYFPPTRRSRSTPWPRPRSSRASSSATCSCSSASRSRACPVG